MTDLELLHKVKSMTPRTWYTLTPEVNDLVKSAYVRGVFDSAGYHLTWAESMDKIRVEYVPEFAKIAKKI